MALIRSIEASWILFFLYMVVHAASKYYMLSEVWGQRNIYWGNSKSEFTIVWMEVGVTSSVPTGKASLRTEKMKLSSMKR